MSIKALTIKALTSLPSQARYERMSAELTARTVWWSAQINAQPTLYSEALNDLAERARKVVKVCCALRGQDYEPKHGIEVAKRLLKRP